MKKYFQLSFSLNIFFLLLFILLGYKKRDKILGLFHQQNIVSESQLLEFNNERIPTAHQYFNCNSDTTISILFLGNSITRHGILTNIWDHNSGMAATTENDDYVHQLVRMVAESKNVNVNYTILNIAKFERNYKQHIDWDILLGGVNGKNPDWVIYQIGENVPSKGFDSNLFIEKYREMLSFFHSSNKIITSPFWNNPTMNYLYQKLAIESGSFLCNISHLSLDTNNRAISTNKYKHNGVNSHPSDLGMKNIAECIFSIINAENNTKQGSQRRAL